MSELTELGEVLHEQHFRILVLVCGLENRIRGEAASRPLDFGNEQDRGLLEELVSSLPAVIEHNAFEEKVLFPLLCRHGEGELAGLLTQEHVMIGPMVRRLQVLAAEMLISGSTEHRWPEFREAAQLLVGEMLTHLQREELAVVQRLGFILDAETDHYLAHSFGDGVASDERPLRPAAPHAPKLVTAPPSGMVKESAPKPAVAAIVMVPAPAHPVSRAMRRPPAAAAASFAARRRSTAPRYS